MVRILMQVHYGTIIIFADIVVHVNGVVSTASQATARREGTVATTESGLSST